jgi:hypothetical protein
MNFFFWLRAILASIIRFFLLLGIGLFYDNFEVSPLPAWTLTVFVYILLFLTSYLGARWIFGKVLPTRRALSVVLVLFLIVQTIAEAILYIRLTHASVSTVVNGYSLISVLLLALHACAIVVAYFQKRRHILLAVVPEGLHI